MLQQAQVYPLPRPALGAAATTAAPPPPLASGARAVWLWCEPTSGLEDWVVALAAEGLAVALRPLSSAPMAHDAVAPDAHVMHVPGGLASRLSALRALRSTWPTQALVVAATPLRDIDQVLALEMGADDVVDGQLSATVLAARLRALWRRSERERPASVTPQDLSFGALSLHWRERSACLAGQAVPLTEGEFEVLWLLASQAGAVVRRQDLLRRLRGLDDDPLDRSIDSRIYRIRAKLGGGAAAARIRTVRHQGYVFSPAGW